MHDHTLFTFSIQQQHEKNSFAILGFMLCIFSQLNAQEWLPIGAGPAIDITRTGVTGVGFANAAAAAAAANGRSLFIVDGTANNGANVLSHWQSGTVGDLNNSTWSGLGLAGPLAPSTPYGLGLTRAGSVGFYNLIPGANGENLIAGFGNGNGNALNRFILRSYDNASSPALGQKDLLIANPRGAIGINEEPFASLSVYSGRAGTLPGVPGNNAPIVRAIAIRGDQPYFFPDPVSRVTTASAMGNQANNSLALTGVAVEGFRSQIPSFVPDPLILNPPTLGVAVNLQAVLDPSGGPNSNSPTVTAFVQNREYAELTWQDLDYLGITNTDCGNQALTDANKFYISFRNGQPGIVGDNAFSVNNKRPVMTFSPNGRVGINNINPACQIGGRPVFLDVNGWVNSTNGFLVGSDRRFKKDIQPIEGAMDKIRRLQGTTYTMRADEFPERAFGEGRQYGFIAQDLERVIPELTGANSDGYYAVNYIALIPVLTEAIKEQDKTITDLRAEVAELRSQFNDLKAGQQPGDLQGYRLDQNAPNPTGGSATIGYALPIGTVGARITVYDLTGRTLKTWVLSDTEGQITVNAGELTSGLYLYDLQVGGRQILERKMSVVKL